MAKISEEINKLQNDSIDLDLQSRMLLVKKNMKGLDSSTDKYNKLVKEVLDLQIKRLENEKSKLKDSTVQEKVSVQSKVTKLEKEIQRQIVSYTKYKLDTKSNASLKNKTSVSLKDLENVFHEFIADVSSSISKSASSSINLSEKKIFRSAVNSKRDKQEAYHTGVTGTSVKDTRQGIATVEVEHILESEKELADSLKEAFVDIKETIESTSSKREFDIQNEKFKLLIDVLNKNRGVIADNLEKELDKLIGAVSGEVKTKSGRLGVIAGKYEDIKADAERLGITEKLNSAGSSLVKGLGKLDGELGNFAESILSSIEGIDRFATGLFKIPETFNNFKKFLGGTASFLSGKSAPDQTAKLEEVKNSIDALGEKFTGVINEKTESGKEIPEIKNFNKGLKGVNKLTKTQAENLGKTNKLAKVTVGLLAAFNIETASLSKKFGLLRLKSLFTGFGDVLNRYAGYILTGALAVYTFSKDFVSKGFLNGIKAFKSGIMSIGSVITSFAKFALPLLVTGVTALTTAFTALSLPIQAIVGGLGLVTAALFLFPVAVEKITGWISSIIDKFAIIVNKTIDYLISFLPNSKRIKRLADSMNPFGSSESEKQAKTIANGVQEKQKDTNPKLSPSSSYGGLGSMAAKSESGKAGSSAIGWDSTGGWSYGQYQVKQSNVPSFMKYLDEDTRKQLENAGPVGSNEFNAKWKELGKSGAFSGAEQKYIEDTHYKPTLARTNSGEELGKRGQGLKELLFSISVNEGERYGSSTINSALQDKDVSKMSDSDIIEAISSYRKSNLKNRYRSSTPRVQASIAKRIEAEKIGALGYDNQRLQVASEQNSTLNQKAQEQMAMNQAKTIAQSMPNPSIINESNSVQNGSTNRPNTPVDLRNSESTFVRNMDSDFGLFR